MIIKVVRWRWSSSIGNKSIKVIVNASEKCIKLWTINFINVGFGSSRWESLKKLCFKCKYFVFPFHYLQFNWFGVTEIMWILERNLFRQEVEILGIIFLFDLVFFRHGNTFVQCPLKNVYAKGTKYFRISNWNKAILIPIPRYLKKQKKIEIWNLHFTILPLQKMNM